MADMVRYVINKSPSEGNERLDESDDERSSDEYDLKHSTDLSAHILDQPYDDSSPEDVAGLAPVPKSHDLGV
jgi:hypothetical protein